VIIRTHRDRAGIGYAQKVLESCSERARVRVIETTPEAA
jgi:hypothetical protein